MQGRKHDVFTFMLCNGFGKEIQVVAWDENAKKMADIITETGIVRFNLIL